MTTDEAYETGLDFAKNMDRPDRQALAKEAFRYEGEIRKAFLKGYADYQHQVLEGEDFLEPDEKY